jgi:hypothetical protein
MQVYDIGDRRKLSCEIRNEDGDLTDPTTLTFTMREPDDAVTQFVYGTDTEVVRDGQGVFRVYWDCELAGFHNWRFEADGTVVVAAEAVFNVRRSQVSASS